MRVKLLNCTENAEKVVAMAARLCYSSSSIEQISERMGDDEVARMIRLLRRRGHLSPFEHAQFTVGIEGLSRVASHQLVRSRIASYSQQSQRHIEGRAFPYVTPPSVRDDEELRGRFEEHFANSTRLYGELRKRGIPKEDARFVLPQAVASSIVMSKNARAWLEWFERRSCNRAQWEIRRLAWNILDLLREAAPNLFEVAGPPCETKGVCFEGPDSCGRIGAMSVESLPFELPINWQRIDTERGEGKR